MSSGGGARQRRGRGRNAAPAEDSLIEETPAQVTPPLASTTDDAAAIVADSDDAEPFDNSDLLLSSEEIRAEIRARLRSHDLDADTDDSSAPATPQRGIPRDSAISSPGVGSQSQSVATGTLPALSSFKAVAAAATRDWYIPWVILLVAGFTRYYRLDRPNSVAFGEPRP